MDLAKYFPTSFGTNPVDDFMKGHKAGAEVYDRDTLFKLGERAIKGDWQGAQNTAFERGAPDMGFKVQDFRDSREDRGRAVQDRARELEKKLATDAAGLFQNFVDREADPARKLEMTQKFLSAHPSLGASLGKYGIDARNPQAVSQFFQAQARGYREPSGADVKEVGGRLVRVAPDGGSATEIYAPDAGTQGAFKDAKQLADVEEGMRKEFTAQSKDYTGIREGFRRIETGAKIDNGAGDLAVVYGYMKMLDPTSVVREGEFATAENTTGVPAYVMNLYNKVVEGARLPPEARTRFSGAAQQLYDNATAQYDQTRAQYEGLARRKSIDPQNVIIDQRTAPPPMPPRADVQGGQGQIPPGAVRLLQSSGNDPSIVQQFEAKYGPGSARQFLQAK